MLEEQAPAASASQDDIDALCRGLRQGDVIDVAHVPLVDLQGVATSEALSGLVIVSQTCDVVLAKRPYISIAPVVVLEGREAEIAARRDNPRFVGLPELGNEYFADLCHIATIHKRALPGISVVKGIDTNDDESVRTFALAIGRWFSRFAFPDEITPWLGPLQDSIRSKYDKPGSPLGRVLQDVVELRAEATDWVPVDLELTLHLIVKAGVVPTLDGPPRKDPRLQQQIRLPDGSIRAPYLIAELIEKCAPSDQDQLFMLWAALAESLAATCTPKPADLMKPGVAGAVSEVVAELWSDDTFPLAKMRKSELLDLDYLSSPTPIS